MLVRESPCSNPTFRCWSPIFLQVKSQFSPIKSPFWLVRLPIGSMYGIFTYIWVICKANVGKYSIHESYGSCFPASTRSCGRCPGWAIWPVWCPRLMRPASRAPSGAPPRGNTFAWHGGTGCAVDDGPWDFWCFTWGFCDAKSMKLHHRVLSNSCIYDVPASPWLPEGNGDRKSGIHMI